MNSEPETTCDQDPASANDSDFRSGELQLQESDAATISQLNYRSESGQVPLPLPDQDREAIAELSEKKTKRARISILEAMLGTTFVCLVLALTNWMSLPTLTLCLGCTAVIVILGLFDHWLAARYRIGISWLLIISYLLAAAISLLRD